LTGDQKLLIFRACVADKRLVRHLKPCVLLAAAWAGVKIEAEFYGRPYPLSSEYIA